MKIAILEAGSPPQALRPQFGSYARMFRQLLGPEYDYEDVEVTRSGFARDSAHCLRGCDAFLITGSAAGVYDGHPWIGELAAFVREMAGRVPIVGACFGHQLMAEAFGGKVIKAPQGWGIGLHHYRVLERARWMDEEVADVPSIAVPVSHQDQVVQLPPDAQVLAGSAFTPYGVLAYPQRRALSFQCHPEFSPAYAESLISLRRGSLYDEALAGQAIESLRAPNDRERVGRWIKRFLS